MKRTEFVIVFAVLILFSCIALFGCAGPGAESNGTYAPEPTGNETMIDYGETNNPPIIESDEPYVPESTGNETEIDYRQAYDSLIVEWESALNDIKSEDYSDKGMLSFSFYGYDNSNFFKAYYALYDIDGNGVPELILRKKRISEDIIAYIFTVKDGKTINIFGYYDGGPYDGKPYEVPWSRVGSSDILSNGLIDSNGGDFTIYKIADDGCSVTEFASSEPYDYPDMARLAEAKWRYYVNNELVEHDFYYQYLNEHVYTIDGHADLAIIDWVDLD